MSTLVASRNRRGRNSTCLKRLAIGAQRCVVVDAAGHVGPVALHDFAVSGFLEIENVESAGRAGDYIGGFLHALGEAASLKESGDAAERRDIGTSGQKFNELTPCGGGRLFHDGCRLYRYFFLLAKDFK